MKNDGAKVVKMKENGKDQKNDVILTYCQIQSTTPSFLVSFVL